MVVLGTPLAQMRVINLGGPWLSAARWSQLWGQRQGQLVRQVEQLVAADARSWSEVSMAGSERHGRARGGPNLFSI